MTSKSGIAVAVGLTTCTFILVLMKSEIRPKEIRFIGWRYNNVTISEVHLPDRKTKTKNVYLLKIPKTGSTTLYTCSIFARLAFIAMYRNAVSHS